MAIDWSPITIISYMCLFPLGIIIWYQLKIYRQTRFRYLLWWFLSGLFLSIGYFLLATGNLFQLDALRTWGFFSFIPLGFFLIILLDAITRDAIDPIKMTIMGVLAAGTVIASFLDQTLFRLAYTAMNLMINVLLAYTGIVVYRASPQSMKHMAKLWAGGAVGHAVGVLLFNALVLQIISSIIEVFTLCLMTYAVVKQQKLAFILPFKLHRLAVIETKGGVPLFSHVWGTSEKALDEDLFSSALQGINIFVKQSMGKGNLREINLEDAVLLVQRSEKFPVACVLLASKSSRTLRDSLQLFAAQFFIQYESFLASPSDTGQFASATSLVERYFNFVP